VGEAGQASLGHALGHQGLVHKVLPGDPFGQAKQEADLSRHHYTGLLRSLEADPLFLGACLEALLAR